MIMSNLNEKLTKIKGEFDKQMYTGRSRKKALNYFCNKSHKTFDYTFSLISFTLMHSRV